MHPLLDPTFRISTGAKVRTIVSPINLRLALNLSEATGRTVEEIFAIVLQVSAERMFTDVANELSFERERLKDEMDELFLKSGK